MNISNAFDDSFISCEIFASKFSKQTTSFFNVIYYLRLFGASFCLKIEFLINEEL